MFGTCLCAWLHVSPSDNLKLSQSLTEQTKQKKSHNSNVWDMWSSTNKFQKCGVRILLLWKYYFATNKHNNNIGSSSKKVLWNADFFLIIFVLNANSTI